LLNNIKLINPILLWRQDNFRSEKIR